MRSKQSKGAAVPSKARGRFLSAARAEFATKGFAGASIRSITGSLGLRESAFYAHFKSKQEAYDAILEEGGPTVMTALVASIDTSKSPAVELSRVADAALEAWTSPEARASTSILLRDAFAAGGEYRQRVLQGVQVAFEALGDRFAQWQTSGEVHSLPDPRTLALQFIAPIINMRLLIFTLTCSEQEEQLGRALLHRHVNTFVQLITMSSDPERK